MPLLLGLASLFLGLLAWVLPVLSIVKHKNPERKKGLIYSIISSGACTVSLFFHILHASYEINRSDWSALGDWAEAIHLPSALIIVTLVLNVISVVLISRDKQ